MLTAHEARCVLMALIFGDPASTSRPDRALERAKEKLRLRAASSSHDERSVLAGLMPDNLFAAAEAHFMRDRNTGQTFQQLTDRAMRSWMKIAYDEIRSSVLAASPPPLPPRVHLLLDDIASAKTTEALMAARAEAHRLLIRYSAGGSGAS